MIHDRLGILDTDPAAGTCLLLIGHQMWLVNMPVHDLCQFWNILSDISAFRIELLALESRIEYAVSSHRIRSGGGTPLPVSIVGRHVGALSAQSVALRIAEGLGVTGVFAVEMFDTDGGVVVNELAMRPHNSGHWTIEGDRTSQFEQHLRAVLDLPLGETAVTAPHVAMSNVLGGEIADLYSGYLHCMARDPGVHLHMYGKVVRPGRKVGHVTTLGEDAEDVRARARHAAAFLRGDLDGRDVPPGPRVGIVMGSDSDWPVMEAAATALEEFDVPFEVDVVSAHRMPHDMLAYGEQAAGRGLRVLVAGAGGAAHLPGMLASVTPLPVIGVPVPLAHLDGMDSLLSMVQMPAGVPVATVAVGGARNAGLLAVRILAASDSGCRAG